MTRQTLTASATSQLSGIETAIRSVFRSLSAPATSDPALEMLASEQTRIRATGRHWLIG